MKQLLTLTFALFLALASSTLCLAGDPDFKGSKDHPLLSRMPGFHISGYETSEFNSYKFHGQDKKPIVIEGRKFYYQYNLDKGAGEPGELKIRRNVQEALKKIGGTVLFDDNFNKASTIMVAKDGNEFWVEVRSYNNMYRLNIVERQAMKQDIVAKAESMGNDINTTGHVSVYGIYFDTGKADIKPESDAALSEIAKLLKTNAGLNVYVVGHTDSVGSFDSNMKLSRDRADSVVKALTGKYGVAAARLKPQGVASLCPVLTNDNEQGRAKNRRVELVKQ